MRHLQLRCMCRSWQSSFKRPLVCLTQPVGCWGVKTCRYSKIFYFAKCAPLYTFCIILWKNYYCATLRSMNRWILLNHGWNSHRLYSFVRFESRGWLYVSNIFEPVSFVFCAASFILRPVSFMFCPSLSVLTEFSFFQSFSIALLECLI